MQALPITNGFYTSPSLPASAQQCTNWYVNVNETEGALFPENLFGTPGSEFLTSSGAGSINRGGWIMAGVPYFVNGELLYRLNRDFTLDALGISTSSCARCGDR